MIWLIDIWHLQIRFSDKKFVCGLNLILRQCWSFKVHCYYNTVLFSDMHDGVMWKTKLSNTKQSSFKLNTIKASKGFLWGEEVHTETSSCRRAEQFQPAPLCSCLDNNTTYIMLRLKRKLRHRTILALIPGAKHLCKLVSNYSVLCYHEGSGPPTKMRKSNVFGYLISKVTWAAIKALHH